MPFPGCAPLIEISARTRLGDKEHEATGVILRASACSAFDLRAKLRVVKKGDDREEVETDVSRDALPESVRTGGSLSIDRTARLAMQRTGGARAR